MARSRLPRAIFFAIALSALAQCVVDFPLLPERIASHFGASGAPNGWMTKQVFFLTYGVLIAVAALVGFYPARSIARTSPARINLPNKEYWLAPERRAATMAFFETHFAWYACILLLTEVLAMGLAIQANLNSPPRLANAPILSIILGFLAFNVAFVVRIFRRFSKIS
jgi:uncharacterized membrane protein